MLTYTDEKFVKWHSAGTIFQSLLYSQATCNIKIFESLAGGYTIGLHMKINHLNILFKKQQSQNTSFTQIYDFFEDYSKLVRFEKQMVLN